MPDPIPPDVSGVGPDWYVDSNWTSTITPAVTHAQNDYTSALSALNSATSTYTTERAQIIADTDQLNHDIDTNQSPAIIAQDKQTLDNERTEFDTAQQTYNQDLTDLETAMYALMSAQHPGIITVENTASRTVDNAGDSALTSFVHSLVNEINHKLTLDATVSTTFATDLSDADTARISARGLFNSALATFVTAQDTLNTARNTLQQLNDNLLLAKAKLASDRAAGADTTQDEADIASLQGQIATQQGTVSTAITTRNSALSTLHSKLTAYQGAIDSEISVLNDAALAMQVSATQFLQDLETAKQGATAAEKTALSHAQQADTSLNTQHFIDFPTDNLDIDAAVQSFFDTAIAIIAGVGHSTVGLPAQTTVSINVPILPPPGHMSLSELMQFITLAEVLMEELIRQLRRADARINELRLSIYSASGAADAGLATAQLQWQDTLLAQDNAYNGQVSQDNATNSTNTVDEINNVIAHVNSINSVITQLNTEIDSQNSRGVDAVTDLNSSVQITVDIAKLRLWADQGQLKTLVDQLNTRISTLDSSDPTKAPLQTVSTDIGKIITDLNKISGDLSIRPLNATTLSSDLSTLSDDQMTLNTHLGNLPTIDSQTQSILTSIVGTTQTPGYIQTVIQDQSELKNSITAAEANAATALKTQVASESSLLTSYSDDLTAAINALPSGDPNIDKLTTLNTDVGAVIAALNTLSSDLASSSINFSTLHTHQNTLDDALSTLNTDRNHIHDNSLSDESLAAVQNIDGAVQNIGATESFLTTYRTATTTTQTIPPALPGQAQMATMPAPTQLQHLPTLNISGITIPSSLPTTPNEVPSPDDVAALNAIVHELNQILVPLLPRLQAAHASITSAIDPLFVRSYIPVREPSLFFTFESLLIFFVLITLFVIAAEIQKNETKDNPVVAAFLTIAAQIGLPNLAGSATDAQGVGSGTGLGGANLFSAAGNIGNSLTAVLSSSAFLNYVNDIILQSGLIAGVQALSNLPTQPPPTTAQPTVTPTPEGATATVVTAPPETVPPGTAPVGAAITAVAPPVNIQILATAINELINTVSNVPQLQQAVLGILKSLGPQNLTDEEIKKLLSLLLFLLQLVALLVGALAVAAAGGQTNIDNIVQEAFAGTQNTNLTSATNGLTLLGVQGLPPGIAPSNPTFLPTVFNVVTPLLTPTEQAGFTAQVTTVFANNGITLNANLPLGTAIQNGLATANPDVAAHIRSQLNDIALNEENQLASNILSDDTKRTNAAAGLNTANATAVSKLPPTQVSTITNQLNSASPQFANLSTESKNTLIVAVANNVITPEQQTGFINELASEETTQKAPTIGVLLSLAVQQQPSTFAPLAVQQQPSTFKLPSNLSLTSLFALTEPGTFRTELGTPGQLPNLVSLIATAISKLSNQTTDQNFAQEAFTLFANLVRDQGDYYHRSLSLIMSPAQTYVKNFSIETRQTTGHDTLGSITQIPIAG